MATEQAGIVAAGHPLTAEAGARVLRDGGNAVDAAVAALLTSFVAEPLLTGLGAGGYLLVAGGDGEPALLDFFVEAPRVAAGRRAPSSRPSTCPSATPRRCSTSGRRPAACTGPRPGCARRRRAGGACRWPSWPRPAAALAERGRRDQRRAGLHRRDPHRASSRARPSAPRCGRPAGRCCARATCCATPSSRRALRRLGAEGAEPFYRGDIAAAISDWVNGRGGSLAGDAAGRVRGGGARAGAQVLPRPRGPDQPAAVGRGHAARLRARRCSTGSTARRRCRRSST